MASTISVKLSHLLTVVETLDPALTEGLSGNSRVTHSNFNFQKTLDAASAPPAAMISEQTIDGSASGTIDLTALPTVQEAAADGTGLKLIALRINNRGTNAFTLTEGAANGYALPGAADIVVPPGGSVALYFVETLADVAAGDKDLDYTFDAADEADLTLILG